MTVTSGYNINSAAEFQAREAGFSPDSPKR